MQRKALADKILLLGVDGLDPRLTKKYVAEGKMPHVAEYIKRGACRDDLVMLGGHPTVTPPMWTTLATGCYANVHGITGFYRYGGDIDTIDYNMDSRNCHAEQLWNVFAEAGKKTLVWHWPGSAWPPSSDNPNLMVIDGTSPGSVGMATSQVEAEYLAVANEQIAEVTYVPKAGVQASAACVITDLDVESDNSAYDMSAQHSKMGRTGMKRYITSLKQHSTGATENALDLSRSPIKPAEGWVDAPEGAKEFTILFSKGLIRRVGLILKNDEGIYDRVALYKNKKAAEPFVVLPLGKMVANVFDEAIKDEKRYDVNRNLKLLRLDPEGKSLSIYISASMDITNDTVYHPKRLFKDIADNVGYPTPTSLIGRQDPMLITECMLDNWNVTLEWQAAAIHYLIENEGLDVVFSHYHAVDLEEHQFIKHLAEHPFNRQPVEVARKWMEDLYVQTDRYLGKFLHFLDEGWTICIFSDHAQVAPKHDIPLLMCISGTTLPLMEEMGYTKTYLDKNGDIQIDWTKTKAVLQREGHIYLNIKGRNQHTLEDGTVIEGIVEPSDQYELEEEIMTKLYQLTDKETQHRIVSVALRNKDAVLLGQGGPEAGDIICWLAEGYNYDHADCLATTYGESDTSVSPIFIGAGQGFKEGFRTERVIRQIDFAPTVAVLGGVRMPAQCEGAPVYQILSEEY